MLWVFVFGTMFNLGLAFHQYIMFIRAYITPEKAIILYIDKLHEANGEFVLLTIGMVLGVYATYILLTNIKLLTKPQ
jgi:hypothetical protein